MRNLHLHTVAIALIILGLATAWAKISILGLPILPNQQASIWVVEARVVFEATGKPAIVNLDIPDNVPGFTRLDESFISRNYGLNIDTGKKDRRAEWSVRRAKGLQRLYYRFDLTSDLENTKPLKQRRPRPPAVPDYPEPLGSAVEDLLQKSRSKSADVFTFSSQLVAQLNSALSDPSVAMVRKGIKPGSEQWVNRLTYVLAGARIPSRLVRGIALNNNNGRTQLLYWMEVHNGYSWQGIDPLSGAKIYPENFVRWSIGDDPLLTVKGGHSEQLQFSVAQQPRQVIDLAYSRAEATKSALMGWTLLDLPVATQNLFRILLMLPVGALIVVAFRVFVGIPTIGTFMPILIALAFRETQLFWGIGLFCLIVGTGLAMRFYLEKLQLLLVPRLSTVLVIVIILMLSISVLAHKLDLEYGFSIALFPIVIIAMVIERMSIIWSETGPTEAYKCGLGSLLVAVLSYLAMNNNYLEHWLFMFPELLAVILALLLWSGRYTGYRLNELIRFRDLTKNN